MSALNASKSSGPAHGFGEPSQLHHRCAQVGVAKSPKASNMTRPKRHWAECTCNRHDVVQYRANSRGSRRSHSSRVHSSLPDETHDCCHRTASTDRTSLASLHIVPYSAPVTYYAAPKLGLAMGAVHRGYADPQTRGLSKPVKQLHRL